MKNTKKIGVKRNRYVDAASSEVLFSLGVIAAETHLNPWGGTRPFPSRPARAKFAMWIVGHAGVLKQSSEWRELINDSKKRNAFLDSSPSGPGPSYSYSNRGRERDGGSACGLGSSGTKRSSPSTRAAPSGSSTGSAGAKRPCAAPPSRASTSGATFTSGTTGANGGSVRADTTSAGVAERMGRDGAAGPGNVLLVGFHGLGKGRPPGASIDRRVGAPPSTFYRSRSTTWTRPELATPRPGHPPVPQGQASEAVLAELDGGLATPRAGHPCVPRGEASEAFLAEMGGGLAAPRRGHPPMPQRQVSEAVLAQLDGGLATPRAGRPPAPQGQVSEVVLAELEGGLATPRPVAPRGRGNLVWVNPAATESGGGGQVVPNSTSSGTRKSAGGAPDSSPPSVSAAKPGNRTNGTGQNAVMGVSLGGASSGSPITTPLPTPMTQPSLVNVPGAIQTNVAREGGGGAGAGTRPAATVSRPTPTAGMRPPSTAVKKCMLAPPVYSGVGTVSSTETAVPDAEAPQVSSHPTELESLPPLPPPPPMTTPMPRPQPRPIQPNFLAGPQPPRPATPPPPPPPPPPFIR